MQSCCDVGSVCLDVCYFLCDNPGVSGTAEARDIKFDVLIEG